MSNEFFNNYVDTLIRKHTGFTSFSDLLSTKPTYRPSLATKRSEDKTDREELTIIADAYDNAMMNIGDRRRAFRF